jgi:hypothetical protein
VISGIAATEPSFMRTIASGEQRGRPKAEMKASTSGGASQVQSDAKRAKIVSGKSSSKEAKKTPSDSTKPVEEKTQGTEIIQCPFLNITFPLSSRVSQKLSSSRCMETVAQTREA